MSAVARTWDAMTCRRRWRVSSCKDAFRQYTGSAQVLCGQAASFCMSLRGAKRRGNPHLLRQHKTMRKYLRRIRRSCEFALSAAYCSVLLQGERIAAPVCALVRNDTSPPVIARSEATWQSVLLAVIQNEKQHFGRIRKVLRIRLKYY